MSMALTLFCLIINYLPKKRALRLKAVAVSEQNELTLLKKFLNQITIIMKKILLAIMLSAATFGAGATVPEFPEASPLAPLSLLKPDKPCELPAPSIPTTGAMNSNSPGLVKLPETALKTPVRREVREHQWGEWYTFKTGTLATPNGFYWYNSVMNINLPLQVKLLRRDATDDASASQLRFEGFLDEYDIFFDWNTETGSVTWEPVELTGVENPDEDIPATFEQIQPSDYNPKNVLRLFAFIVTMRWGTQSYGWNGCLEFVADDLPDASVDFSLDVTDYESGDATVSFNSIGSDVAEVRYGLFYVNNIYYDWWGDNDPRDTNLYVNGSYLKVGDILRNQISGFDTVSFTPAGNTYSRAHKFDRSGFWALAVMLLDRDGDEIGFEITRESVGLTEAGKWKDAGFVEFTDGYVSSSFDMYKKLYASGDVPELSLPAWASGSFTWKVALEQSTENPSLYRLVNPYSCDACPMTDATVDLGPRYYPHVYKFDKSHNYYYIFNLSNPQYPWAYITPTDLKVGGGHEPGDVRLEGMMSQYQSLEPENYSSTGYGTTLIYDPEGCVNSRNSKFEIRFPWYVDYRVGFSATWKDVVVEKMGEGVAQVKYTVLKADADSEGIYDRIDAGDPSLTIGTASQTGALDLSAFDVEPEYGRYTLYAVTYDASGNRHKEVTYSFVLYKHDYKFYSKAMLRESILEEGFGVPCGFYEVNVYVADDAEGHYFVSNPYGNHPILGEQVNCWTAFMDIDCSDPERVNIPEYTIPMHHEFYGTMTVQSMSNYYMNVGGYSADEVAAAGYFGSFRDGQVKLPGNGGIISVERGGTYFPISAENGFCLRFPWYIDYGFELVKEYNALTVKNIESGVARIAFAAVEQGSMSEAELKTAFDEGRIECFTPGDEGVIDLAQHGFEAFRSYTVAVASFDSEGGLREYKTAEVYLEGDYVAAGTGIYTDAFLQFIFYKDEIEDLIKPREVELFTCNETPGVIFVKNPFTDALANVGLPYCLSEYLPIDVTDPARVFIPRGCFGIASGSSRYYMYSKAETYRAQGIAEEDIPAEAFGTLSGGKIVIPTESLEFTGFDYDPEFPNPALVLELPENLAGVEAVGVEAVSGESEYFDLQGRRVKNPAAGFYLERRGATVKKVFIR